MYAVFCSKAKGLLPNSAPLRGLENAANGSSTIMKPCWVPRLDSHRTYQTSHKAISKAVINETYFDTNTETLRALALLLKVSLSEIIFNVQLNCKNLNGAFHLVTWSHSISQWVYSFIDIGYIVSTQLGIYIFKSSCSALPSQYCANWFFLCEQENIWVP